MELKQFEVLLGKSIKMKYLVYLSCVFFLLQQMPAQAQSLEEGRKLMYYEKFKSAKAELEKCVSANPDREESLYWLGQALIAPDDRTEKDIASAKALYLAFLEKKPNSPLILAGVGHIELLEGKTRDARSHFETAISLSQAKNASVLNAIGFANGNPDSKNGDAAYAIEKLKLATQIKGMKDPDVWINLGDAYRVFTDGGNAILAYQEAQRLDQNYARASYRIGKVYESQGAGQKDLFLKYFEEAEQKDQRYAPAYEALFHYYYEYDPAGASKYLDKWIENSEKDVKACYYRALLEYRQSKFREAVDKAEKCIREESPNIYPNVYGLLALAFNRLGDSLKTKENFEEYFRRQKPEKIGSGDYAIYATNLLKFPGLEAEAGNWIEKAIALDSVEANKINYLKSMAAAYESRKQFREAGDWYSRILTIKSGFGKTDLYNAGYSYFRSGAYPEAISVFNKYVEKYPDDIFGYYMIAKSNAGIDTTSALGLAVPFYELAISKGQTDSVKNKDKLLVAYKYLTEYYYNIRKSKDTALYYIDKALILSPEDEELGKIREFISKSDPAARKKPAPTTSPANKP